MAGPLTEAEELELLELELQEAQAKAARTSQSPFLQRGVDMTAAAIQSPGKGETRRVGKAGKLDAKNDRIRATQSVQRAFANQQNVERMQRVMPVTGRADRAAQAAEQQYTETAPFPDRTDRMMTKDAARQQVYNAADVASPADAFQARAINSMALGAPGFVSKDFRETMRKGGEDQPMASLAGDLAGFVIPGEVAWKAGAKAYNSTLKPVVNALAPKGGSGLARTGRLGQRYLEQAGAWAGQNALYQGTVGESTAAAAEGRDPSFGSAMNRAGSAFADPINLAGPAALMGANRVLTFLRSGGATATPGSVEREVSRLTEGRVGGANAPQSAASQVLDMGLAEADIRPQSIARVIRNLESAGMSREDITGLFESVQQRLGSLPEAEAARLTLGQALLEALENPELSRAAGSFPQAAAQLRQTLRNASQGGPIGAVPRRGDQRAGIVSGVRRELQGSQTDFAQNAIDDALGDSSLISIDDLVAAAKREIGGGYNDVLRAADSARPEAAQLSALVIGDDLKSTLTRRAKNAGFQTPEGKGDVDAYARARPDEAAHWLRSALDSAKRSAQGKERTVLQNSVDTLDELLDTNPGYPEARKAYGTEIGVEEATEFGNRFIASSKNEYSVDLLMRQLEGMSDRERAVALSSIRNNLRSYLRGSQEDASAKITQLTNVGALNALERLGPEGKRVADALRFLRREQGFLGNVGYGSDTGRNLSAGQAEALGNTPLQNATGGQGGMMSSMTADLLASSATGNPTAIFTPLRIAAAGMKNVFAPRVSTLNDEIRFLMGRRGNIPDLPQSGTADFTPPPSAPAATSRIRTNESGSVRPSVAGGLAGGSTGGMVGANEDLTGDGKVDWRDIVVGTGVGTLGGVGLGKGMNALENALNRPAVLAGKPKRVADMLPPKPDIPKREINRDMQRRWDLAMEAARKELANRPPLRVVGPDGVPQTTEAEVEELAIQYARIMGVDPAPFIKATAPTADVVSIRPKSPDDPGGPVRGAGFFGFGGGKKPNSPDAMPNPAFPMSDATYVNRLRRIRNEIQRDAAERGETLSDVDLMRKSSQIYDDIYNGKPSRQTGERDSPENIATAVRKMQETEARRRRVAPAPEAEPQLPPSADPTYVNRMLRIRKEIMREAADRGETLSDTELLRRSSEVYGYVYESPGRLGGKPKPVKPDTPENIAAAVRRMRAQKDYISRNGLGAVKDELGQQAILAGFGSIGGSANDLNGDGKNDWQDAAIGAAGAMVGVNGVRAVGAARNALGVRTAGAGGKRPPKPKPDSPDAIKNALRDIAKAQPKEPTRLERMVKDNQIPVNSPDRVAPDAVQSAGNRAQRMAERGKDPFEIYDETSIVFVPYNGQNIPIYSTQQGPEEVIRTFYSWLREPKETWPQFVTDIVNQAPKKRTMRLGDENAAAVPPGAIPQPAPPMPKAGFPVGGAAIGAAAGAATGIPGGALIGYAMTQNERKVGRPRQGEKRTVGKAR